MEGKLMKQLLRRLLCRMVCAVLLAGCAGGSQTALPTGVAPFGPNGQRYNIATQLRSGGRAPGTIVGVYVSEFYATQLLNYDYAATGSPLCETGNVTNVQSIQSDVKHELIVPWANASGQGTVYLYKESAHLCLPNSPTASFAEPYGQPADGFSLDGTTYYIANRNGVAVCKLSRVVHGCVRELTNTSGTNNAIAVTADSSGVYGVVFDGYTTVHLVYWKAAKGKGTVLSGYINKGPGGIYFDAAHNLLAIDAGRQALYVYTGCPSACTPNGPFSLSGSETIYGMLANGNSEFMTLDQQGTIDVYQYHGLYGLTFLYSNSAGLNSSLSPMGIAQRL